MRNKRLKCLLGWAGGQEPVFLQDQSKEFILGDSANVGVNSRAMRLLSFSLKVNQLEKRNSVSECF